MAPRSCKMSSAAIVSLRIRLSAKATSSGMRRIEVMGDHHHVERLVERIYRVRPRRSRRRRDDIWLAADFDDVRGMSAARPFGVKACEWFCP